MSTVELKFIWAEFQIFSTFNKYDVIILVNHGLDIPACIMARASRTCRDECRDR